jgi:hypothetical protein
MKIHLLALIFFVGLAELNSCNKSTLDQAALGALNESDLTNKNGVEGLLIGAYSMLDGIDINNTNLDFQQWGASGSNWIYGSVCGTEAHKGSDPGDQSDIMDLEKFIASSTNKMLASKWGALYEGVSRTNRVLIIMKKAKDIKPDDQRRIAAEARFLRGFYHFEAVKIWNHVPYVDDSISYEAGNYRLGNTVPIWADIESDFIFAKDNLPVIMNAVGRANKFVAEAYLAKLYMFEHDFPKAKALFDDIIQNGVTAIGHPYALKQHYADNFNPDFKNDSESIFAAQSSVNDGASGNNGDMGDILNYPYGGPIGCCGFFQPSQWLVNHFKTDPSTGLPDLDFFDQSDVTSDQGVSPDSPYIPYQGALDPRLDWTVGRRGIPYLDWGVHQGASWIRNQASAGPYSPIKNVYYKYQQGHLNDHSFWTQGSTATNINLFRFSDLLLLAAEAETELGNLNQAEKYVNMVRNRAADPSGWVHTYVDPSNPDGGYTSTSAAFYFINPYPPGNFGNNGQDFARKAIRYERLLELGMEGHRFFDLVRWGIAGTEITRYLGKEHNLISYLNGVMFQSPKNEYFPIPQAQIDLSVGPDGKRNMIQNPGY